MGGIVEITQGKKTLYITDCGSAQVQEVRDVAAVAGCSYFATDIDEDLDIVESLEYLLRAPVNTDVVKHVHYDFGVNATSACKVEIRKTPVYSASGAAVTLMNRNGNFADGGNSKIFKTPTLTGGVGSGTAVASFLVGTSNIAELGGSLAPNSIVPEIAEEYLLRITPYSDDTKVGVVFETYECLI